MADILVSADAEQALIDELSPHVTVPIGTGIPSPVPDVFIRIVQVGGSQRDLVTDTAMLMIEVFNIRSESAARELAARLLAIAQRAALVGDMGGVTCYRLQTVAGIQNYGLPSLPTHHRYITTVAPDLRRRVETL